MFAQLVENRQGSMTALAEHARIHDDIAGAFRAAFLSIAGFAAVGALLAWSIPTRRLT